MNRDKQIEEMAKAVYESGSHITYWRSSCKLIAEALYNAGYRKSTDLAEEIFAEIERNIFRLETPYQTLHCIPDGLIAELKKKYIGKDTNVTTNTEDKGRDKLAEFSKYSPLSWKYTEGEE